MDSVTLGSRYKDSPTGFTGTATRTCTDIGQPGQQVLLEGTKGDGEPTSMWSHTSRLSTAS